MVKRKKRSLVLISVSKKMIYRLKTKDCMNLCKWMRKIRISSRVMKFSAYIYAMSANL